MYKIIISPNYYKGTHNVPQKGFVMDRRGDFLKFETKEDAQDWIDKAESSIYYLNHGEAGRTVIINGEFHHTYGPPVGLITDGQCWLLGVYSHHNLASSNQSNYLLDQTVAYLDCCDSSDSPIDIAAASTVYVRDFDGDASNTGDVQTY